MKKKLNTWTVSGLMIGPILGSGIVFLPPLAYEALGNHAIWAWGVMMALGGLFAYVFAKMAVMTKSNEGMSLMVGNMLGGRFRELSSNYLTAAVFFGPVAVAKTAAGFLKGIFPGMEELALAALVLVLCYGLIASGVTAMGRLILLLSTATTLLLIGGSGMTLFSAPAPALPTGLPDLGEFGGTLLFIFWAIIGWEVLGNYIEDVHNPERTIVRAMKISLVVIVAVYMATTFALQTYYQTHAGEARIQPLLFPLMGEYADPVFSILAAGLCICTVVSVLGAVTRQIRARSEAGLLPAVLGKKHVPLLAFISIHTLVMIASLLGILDVENMVGIANTFFIGNALLGLAAGFLYFKNKALKVSVAVLILMLALLLLFSKPFALIAFAGVTALSLWKSRPAILQTDAAEDVK